MTPAEVATHLLLATTVVVIAARALGAAVTRIGQPRVLGELVAGILLGPSLLGEVWPEALDYLFPPDVIDALRAIAVLGLTLFVFLVGLELDLGLLRRQGRRAVAISAASIVLPMALGAALAVWLFPRLGHGDELGFVLFVAVAMAITALPVLARLLQETGLFTTRIGVLAIACAAVDDVMAWCLLAGVVAAVQASGVADAVLTIVLAITYAVVMVKVVRPVIGRLEHVPVWLAVVFALLSAWLTDQIGIHAIFGAFLAGAVMPRRAGTRQAIEERLQVAVSDLLLPIFFVVVGLSTRVDALGSAYLWGLTALVIATAVAGKWGGAMAAARLTGETWRDATMIGVLMNTRGLTEIVIATVGLELGVITATVYTMLVLMALVTTFMAAPILAVIEPSTRRHASQSQRGSPPPAHPTGAREASPGTSSTTPNHGDQCASS